MSQTQRRSRPGGGGGGREEDNWAPPEMSMGLLPSCSPGSSPRHRRRSRGSGSTTESALGGESSQTQKSENDEKFAQLLRPIKDLTENMDFPLAERLQEYYEHLTGHQFHLDGGGGGGSQHQEAKVNFTHAALVLQGSAAMYSRKVEFLWQTLLGMLDLLASKRALEEAGDGGHPPDESQGGNALGGRGRARKGAAALLDPLAFALIPLEVVKCSSSELRGGLTLGSAAANQRKLALKFISVTPRQLIEKEGRESARETTVNLYCRGSAGGPSSSSARYDLIGHKEDFRVNLQFSLETAMIGEDLTHMTQLGQQSVSLCDEDRTQGAAEAEATSRASFLSGDEIGGGPEQLECDDALLDAAADDHLVDADPGENDDPGTEDAGALDIPEGALRQDAGKAVARKRDKLAEICQEPKAPLEDPWEPLDPSEVPTVAPKPFRRGRTARDPQLPPATPGGGHPVPGRKGLRQTKRSLEAVVKSGVCRVQCPSASEYVTIEDLAGPSASASGTSSSAAENRRCMLAPELSDKTRAAGKRSSAGAKTAAPSSKAPPADREVVPEDGDEEEDDDPADLMDNEGWADFGGDEPLPDPDPESVAIPSALDPGIGGTTSAMVLAEVDSYEDLVMRRVANYVAQSQEYIESTDLAKRVAKWHETIGPRLDLVERRGDFDIHLYGSQIIDSFPSSARDKATTTTAQEVGRGSGGDDEDEGEEDEDAGKVKFSDMVAGCEPEEVARIFLSSLMLANTYNIDLRSASGLPLAMDDLQVTLLSTQRHHEHMFRSPEPPVDDSHPEATDGRRRVGKGRKRDQNQQGERAKKPRKATKTVPEVGLEEDAAGQGCSGDDFRAGVAGSQCLLPDLDAEHRETLEMLDRLGQASGYV